MHQPAPFRHFGQPPSTPHISKPQSEPNRFYLPAQLHSRYVTDIYPAENNPHELKGHPPHHQTDAINPAAYHHQQHESFLPTHSNQHRYPESLPLSTTNRDDAPLNSSPALLPPQANSRYANPIDQPRIILQQPAPSHGQQSSSDDVREMLVSPQAPAHEPTHYYSSALPQTIAVEERDAIDTETSPAPLHQVADGADVMVVDTTTRRHIEGLPTQDEEEIDTDDGVIDDRINPNTLKSLVGK